MQSFRSFRLWLNKYDIPGVVFWGTWFCPILPLSSSSIFTYVGEPMELPKIEEPTKEDIEKWHGAYIAKLQELFEANKVKAGAGKDAVLVIN